MTADFHVFFTSDGRGVTVAQDGIEDQMEFPSLSEATRHLRTTATGFVVIHDASDKSTNRIPLAPAG